MGFAKDVWNLAKESPDQRRARLAAEAKAKARVKAKPSVPTNHPDDAGSFAGLDSWWGGRKKIR